MIVLGGVVLDKFVKLTGSGAHPVVSLAVKLATGDGYIVIFCVNVLEPLALDTVKLIVYVPGALKITGGGFWPIKVPGTTFGGTPPKFHDQFVGLPVE